MSTRLLSHLSLEALSTDNALPFGPWAYRTSRTYAQFVGAEIQIAGTTQAQIIGGVSPSIVSITTIHFLFLRCDLFALRIGLHGVSAQGAGFTLNARQILCLDGGSINALNIYNTGATPASIVLVLGET